MEASGVGRLMPALRNSAVSSPKRDTTSSVTRSVSVRVRASAWRTTTPSGSSCRAAAIVAGFWPVTITRYPRSWKSSALARPIPLVPPVIRTAGSGMSGFRGLVVVARGDVLQDGGAGGLPAEQVAGDVARGGDVGGQEPADE